MPVNLDKMRRRHERVDSPAVVARRARNAAKPPIFSAGLALKATHPDGCPECGKPVEEHDPMEGCYGGWDPDADYGDAPGLR